MIKKRTLNQFIGLSVLMAATVSTAFATENNFNCPQPSEIQSTDFTSPSIWVAPPVPHSVPGQVGVGLGGKNVKEFVGVEAAEINHHKGWVCVYKSEGGLSVREYQAKIRQLTESNKFLRKYLAKVNEEFENAEPYLKKFPQDSAIGFVGYQKK